MARTRRVPEGEATASRTPGSAAPRPSPPAADIVGALQEAREGIRHAWIEEMTRRGLFRGFTPAEAEAEFARAFAVLVECLGSRRYHSAQAFAQDLAGRDVFRGIGATQVISRLLVLRDVCGRSLQHRHGGGPGRSARALDVYEPVINRILTIAAMAFVQERERAVGWGREQLGALVEAGMMLAAERSLDSVLQRITDVACTLLDARFGALGVLDDQGGLTRFITSGLDEDARRSIGAPPVGRGILGVLMREPKPLRLQDLTRDPRAFGFPANHPPMHSFLGVPIVFKGKFIGNLYLTEKQGAEEFSKEDEKLAVTLAAQAAVAIENTSLYEELRRSYEELKQSQQLLVRQEKLASLGRLAAGLAHELNNPLSSVAGFAEALQRRLAEGQAGQASGLADFREYLGLIQEEVERAATIVRRLLDFARMREPTFEPVGLERVVANAVTFVERSAHLANQRIMVAPFPRGAVVHADGQMLQQVFLNLLTNALDAIEGTGEVRIEARLRHAGEAKSSGPTWIDVMVSDSGSGIAPEHLGKVFDPFFTTKEVGKGTGLGLAICQSIVEQHGGSIEVESEGAGKGATVTVSLPLADYEK
jgi:signal transduction histidine kinase